MKTLTQPDLIRMGSVVWNKWREEHPELQPELSGVDLMGADLMGADLSRAFLIEAHFEIADLRGANLSRANLNGANLNGADLRGADLSGAILSGANLNGADLSGADLSGAYLIRTILSGTILSKAILWETCFGNVDLSTIKGLTTVKHRGPSIIGIDTFYRSKNKIPKSFLRGAGVSNTFVGNICLAIPATEIIKCMATNFHLFIHYSNTRYSERKPLITIEDEYDVQDTLHGLLRLFFKDIRKEEGAPSHAGKNSRIDFFLAQEQIVVETKKTRDNLREKEVGKELTIDIIYYKKHQEYNTFIGFVYDPDRYIKNPAGLVSDLQQTTNDMKIIIIINQG